MCVVKQAIKACILLIEQLWNEFERQILESGNYYVGESSDLLNRAGGAQGNHFGTRSQSGCYALHRIFENEAVLDVDANFLSAFEETLGVRLAVGHLVAGDDV